ncbi:MAG: PAS domain-containing protein [Actinomycetota bacterium]
MIGLVVLGLGLHLAFARLASVWEFDDRFVNPLWPAVGVVIGTAMAIRHHWWLVVIGALVGKVINTVVFLPDTSGQTIVAALVAQGAEQVLAIRLALHILAPPEISRPSARTIGLVVVGTAGSAALGGGLLVSIGQFGATEFRDWFVGESAGMLLGAPTAYGLWRRSLLRERIGHPVETVASVVVVAAFTVWSFELQLPVVYFLLPLIAWIGVRFGIVVAAPASLVVAMWGTWRSSELSGPFADLEQPVLAVQLFTAALGLTAVAVGTLTIEIDRQRRRLGGLLAELPDQVLVLNEDGVVLEDFARNSLGEGPLVGRNDVDLVEADAIDDVVTARKRWVSIGRAEMVTQHRSGRTGEIVTYETRLRRIGPDRAVAVARSIEERQQAVAEQRRLARRWRTLMTIASEGFAEVDEHGHVIDANDPLARVLGHNETSLLGVELRSLITDAQWPGWAHDLERIITGERVSRSIDVNGRSVSVVVLPRLDADGAFAGAMIAASMQPIEFASD